MPAAQLTPPRWPEKRRKTPTVLQMEAVECGAASLGIVLGHFGRFEPLEKLRAACGVSRDGSKASNILKAARTYGMEAKGFRLDMASLPELPLPVIAFWDFNHFLVVEGSDAKRIYLNDPSKGPRTVSAEEFARSYSGVALSIRPGAEFRPGGERPSILRALRSRFTGCRPPLIYAMLTALFLVIPGIVAPALTQVFIDEILVGGSKSWIRPLLVAMAVTAIFQAALSFLQKYYLLRMETKLAITGATQFLGHILRLPISFFFQRYAGDVAGRMNLNDKVASLLADQVAVNVVNGLMIAFYLVIMLQYDWMLSLVSVAMATLNLVVLRIVSRRRKDLNQRLQMEMGKLLGQSMTGLQLIETLKASGSESDFFSQWAGHQAKTINSQQEFAITGQFLSAIPPLLSALNTAVVLGVGSFRVIDGDLTIGMLVAFQFLMASFMNPVNQLVALGGSLQDAWSDILRLDDVQRHPQDPFLDRPALDASTAPSQKLSGRVDIEAVTFGYSPLDPPLITDFHLSLRPGQRVALVGGSGSGKSTIAKIVSGLYQPWSGQILFDGRPSQELPRETLTASVSMVDQEIFLFAGTVRDNITMWDTSIPAERVVQAAADAQILDDILVRPGGLDSVVQEGGGNLSGGQRQRLEIARALVTDPAILILDEATSALDTQTEQRVDECLRRRGCTCIIVAHRLSTIRDADEIIVLDRGHVVQRGTHEELKAQPGPYAELIAAQ